MKMTYARLEQDYLEPPEDPRESPEWEAKQIELWDERIMDIHGYFKEAIFEYCDDSVLKRLAMLIRCNQNGTHSKAIGAILTKLVVYNTKPDDDEVDEALNGDC